MKKLCILAAIVLAWNAPAYDGKATVSRDTEAKEKIHFQIQFAERDGLLDVTVTAPPTTGDGHLPLAEFTLLQAENRQPSLRARLAAAASWSLEPEATGKLVFKPVGMPSSIRFSVAPARLSCTQLEARYGAGDPSWTYVIDLASYRDGPETPLPEAEVAGLLKKLEASEKIELPKLYQALAGPQTTLRAQAAARLGKDGNWSSAPYLIAALADESAHVGARHPKPGMETTRYWANESLKQLTGQDFGFAWNDPAEKRSQAIARWQEWLRKRTAAIATATGFLKAQAWREEYVLDAPCRVVEAQDRWSVFFLLKKLDQDPSEGLVEIDKATQKATWILLE